MKKLFLLPCVILLAYGLFLPCFGQPTPAPGGVATGLLGWYDGTSFDNTSQKWNPKIGAVSLERFAKAGSRSIVSQPNSQLNNQLVLTMEGAGLRASLLPNNPTGAYTVFAVSERTNSASGAYTETTWGFGTQSASPGFVQGFSGSNKRHSLRNTTSRSDDFLEIHPAKGQFRISSLNFAYGLANASEPKMAAINGEFRQIDAGNFLPPDNGWVYINANAAFIPATFEAQYHNFAEFIVYNRKLTDAERHRVHTYLSLKYSLPLLVEPAGGSRITLDGVTDLWDQTQGFNKDVIGIGRRTEAALNIRTAYGTYPDLGIETLDNLQVSTNNSFLLIGDKGNHFEFAGAGNTTTIPGGKRLKQIWRVQNSGLSDSLRLFMPSLVVPGGAQSLDACAPVRLLISPDSTFTTYTALKLTPTLLYGTTTPPLFSGYLVNAKFRQGESYVTFATINSPGTPLAGIGNVDSEKLDNCADDNGFYYFLNTEKQPVFGIKGLTAAQINQIGLKVGIKQLNQPVVTTNATMMKRLLTLTSSSLPAGTKATIRFYFRQQELTEAQLPGGTGIWFKKESATADLTVTDFSADGTLTPGTFAVLNGTRGTQNGTEYVEFNDLQSFSTFGYISSISALPVRLTNFEGKLENQTAQLSWHTSSELNADYFEIHRSTDARNWESIGVVKALGNTTANSSYSFTDASVPGGIAYYRLKMQDFDGTAAFSRAIALSNESAPELVLFPNPSNGNFVRLKDISGQQKKIKDVVFRDSRGIQVLRFNKNLFQDLNVSELTSGIYTVVVRMVNGETTVRKLVITR